MDELKNITPYEMEELNIKLPFYASGRLVLILKMSIPLIRSENKTLEARFNSFYEKVKAEYERLCTEYVKEYSNLTRPAVLKLKFNNLTTKLYKIEIERSASLVLPEKTDTKTYTDIFSAENGLFMRRHRAKTHQAPSVGSLRRK